MIRSTRNVRQSSRVNVPGQQIPTATPDDQPLRLDSPYGLVAVMVDVVEAQALSWLESRRRSRSAPLDPQLGRFRTTLTVAARSASIRCRSRDGMSCSSLTSARSEASSMPATPAARGGTEPDATATTSSSSSSSGGMVAPLTEAISATDAGRCRRPDSRGRAAARYRS